MTVPRIYCSETLREAEGCELGADNLRYLKTVLRLKPGDPIIVFDGYGHEFSARIAAFGPSRVSVLLVKPLPSALRPICLTLAQGIPKAGKMDLIVRTAAELGTDVIIPFTAARCVPQLDREKAAGKVARWQKIVREAARCTRSPRLAVIEQVLPFDEMLAQAALQDRKLIFWEEEDRQTIRHVLHDARFADAVSYFIIVGPEGGLTRDEVARAGRAGFASVTLGKHILKVETAAAAILSIVQYEKGIFGRET
ncbi:MAG: 16S rRNA (uracil(1498)-N(3))-methyltransferase [Deltaproteobacteria bacterium]|nr:16S rRNA (uracil(1498)-N(3))-methyltransferase [Deltaproteobacteria bacterium]